MLARLVVAGWLLLAATPGSANPFVPASDAQVLERLPRGLSTVVWSPGQTTPARAADTARRYLLAAREAGDPRYLGYAEATLKPWLAVSQPPGEILLLRATLHQAQHRFEAALVDLEQLLARQPDNAQGWLTRAVVEQVTGDLAASRRSCVRLLGLVEPSIVAACGAAASADAASTEAAYRLLGRQLAAARLDAAGRRWVLTVLAGTAERLGRWAEAEAHYQAALAVPGSDVYLLGALGRLLLDRQRPAEVLSLLAEAPDSDELLLLQARAARRLDSPRWPALQAQIRERVALGQQRGDELHPGFLAEAHLTVLDDPVTAVALARVQWQRQREARDLRLLLAAALAADQPDAARPGLDWQQQVGFSDLRLQTLLARLQAQSAGQPSADIHEG